MLGLGLGINISQSPVVSGVGGGAWTPTSLGSALAAWYDADQQTEANNASVATFTDRSGNLKDFVQATGAAQPIMKTAQIGGKRALFFDGSLSMTCSGLLNSASAGSWFAVVQLVNDPPAGTLTGPVLDNFTSGAFGNHHPFDDGVIYDGFGVTARNTCGNPTPSMSAAPAMLAAIAGPSDYRFLVNSSTLFSTAGSTIGFGTGTRTLGKQTGASFWFNGYVAEIIVTNAVPSSGDIASIRSYFNTKFGTSF